MTDKELIKQAYDALDKITDMFEAVNGRCVIGGDDVYYSAVKVMVKLNERLKHEQGAVAVHWRSLQLNGGRPISQPKQKPWVGLTHEEVSQLIDKEIGFNSRFGGEHLYTRAVEAKLKEKNR